MKKVMDGKIVEVTDDNQIAERVSHRGHSNDPIGWESIHLVDGVYYLCTTGGHDIFSPEDNMEKIGNKEALIGFVSCLNEYGENKWAMDTDIIEHLEA